MSGHVLTELTTGPAGARAACSCGWNTGTPSTLEATHRALGEHLRYVAPACADCGGDGVIDHGDRATDWGLQVHVTTCGACDGTGKAQPAGVGS